MKRRMTIVLLVLFSALCPLKVAAEHYPEETTDWVVTFTGKQLQDNFGEDEITQMIKGLQPGDSAGLEVSIVNDSKKKAYFYMENSVLKSFEDETVIEALQYGGYVYELTYTPAAGGEDLVIYSSKKVGGEDNDKENVGLHEATDALDGFFWLEEIAPGGSGKVKVHIELDGASQANIYQDTIGKILLDFAVEVPVEGQKKIYRLPHTGVGSVYYRQLDTISKLISGACLCVMMVSAFILLFVRRGGKDDEAKA